ncbi:unnamed protein product [marine sediment metagenome]|uniref:Uncharacterized protein n=1 Tax=marine sediment metagenome TaxID=412755 RepID=X1E8E0_9ZZZZ
MVKKSEGSSSKPDEGEGNYITDLKGKIRRCFGSICFTTGGDGEIVVDVDKSKAPECAELVSKYLLAKKRVRFNLGEDQPVMDSKENKIAVLKKQLEKLESGT